MPRTDMWKISPWLLQRGAGEWMNKYVIFYSDLHVSYFSLSWSVFLKIPFRKRSSWMARSSSLCYDAHVQWRTVTSRSSRSTQSSTWLSGSCASSHAPYHGPVYCVYGTCSSVKVSFIITWFIKCSYKLQYIWSLVVKYWEFIFAL